MRVYRQICLLRARGAVVEAARMEAAELEPALAKAAGECAVEISWADHFVAEQLRISEARLLAELLAPLLAERLQPAGMAPPFPAPDSNPHVIDPGSSPLPSRRGSASPLEVADLIEGMLAQERTENIRRPAPSPTRSLSAQRPPAPSNHPSS